MIQAGETLAYKRHMITQQTQVNLYIKSMYVIRACYHFLFWVHHRQRQQGMVSVVYHQHQYAAWFRGILSFAREV